jgi:ComF family protein
LEVIAVSLLRRAREAGARAANWSIEIVMPKVCAGCGLAGEWMCVDCAQEMLLIDPGQACQRCGQPETGGTMVCRRCRWWSSELEQARAAVEFGGPAREAVHRLKYGGEYARAEWCAAMMMDLLATFAAPPDVVCAVPLARRRRRARGFNQSEVIGRALAEQTNLAYLEALERIHETPPQVGLSAAERSANVFDAFRARQPLTDMTLLIVDDVLTTGATMRACARAAVQAGAAHVVGITFATESWR